MIFRKPYAFLIKYFKLINFIIAILTTYIGYRTYSIITFFNDYIKNNYTGNIYTGFSDEYISLLLYFAIIITIIGLFIIVLLFIYKKKPNKMYLSSILYYTIFLIFIIYLKSVMTNLEINIMSAEASRIYRDLTLISIIPQVLFIIIFLLRGLGVNYNKFNFKEDLKELEISEEDSEEVEIVLKNDNVKLKRNIRRFIREFKYYIKENKFMFIIICTILIIVMGIFIYKKVPDLIDQTYNQKEYFNIGNIKYNLEDSIITNLNYNGEIIDDNYYIVIRLFMENESTNETKIDFNSFRLELNNKYIYPILDKGTYFIDYAPNKYKDTLKGRASQTVSLIYKLNSEEIVNNYKIKILDGSIYKDKKVVSKYKYVNLTPIKINDVKNVGKYNLNEEVMFKDTNLGNTTFKINNIKITDKYVYNYENCINENCITYKDIITVDYTNSNTTLLVMDYEYLIDESIPYYNHGKDITTFANDYLKIKYINEGNNVAYKEIVNVKLNKTKDKLILETSDLIEDSNEVYLAITIRNKEFSIKLR